MNESYSTMNYSKNFVSLTSLNKLSREVEKMESEVFTSVDNLKLSPGKEILKKIFSYL
jgi:hypothetical protein